MTDFLPSPCSRHLLDFADSTCYRRIFNTFHSQYQTRIRSCFYRPASAGMATWTRVSPDLLCFDSGPRTAKLGGPAERGHVKNRQKVSKIFSTLFDISMISRAGQKNVKNRQKVSQTYFRHFSTILVRHQFSGPFFWKM